MLQLVHCLHKLVPHRLSVNALELDLHVLHAAVGLVHLLVQHMLLPQQLTNLLLLLLITLQQLPQLQVLHSTDRQP